MKVPVALTIAGSDSGGGAGIQADLKAFAACGVHGVSAITALTAQNTRGVSGIQGVPADFVTAQLDALFADFEIGAAKTGMVAQPEIIKAIAAAADKYRIANLVVDPVMVATSGDRLLVAEAENLIRELLLPRALVVTPNLREAAVLLGEDVAETEDAARAQGERLLKFGSRAVLIKGGHGKGPESADFLVTATSVVRLAAPRVDTRNTHGTGCTLSASTAAFLARGFALEEAVRRAKAYVSAAIAAGASRDIGSGHGPVHHFHALKIEN